MSPPPYNKYLALSCDMNDSEPCVSPCSRFGSHHDAHGDVHCYHVLVTIIIGRMLQVKSNQIEICGVYKQVIVSHVRIKFQQEQ